MVKIKICGLTSVRDILFVNQYHPDYVGFVFADSRRKVTPYIAREMIGLLSPSIKKVGVFVNEHIEKVNEISEICQLDIVQLHGNETPYYCLQVNKPVWKAVRVKDAKSLDVIKEYGSVDAILLDTFSEKQYGGTGTIFDWDMVKQAGIDQKIVLAGGLNAANVTSAIKAVRPYCVDVSSSVETDGIKDGAKIKEFIDRVRLEDKNYV
ncbi:MAG: phosphoribosylanthranilate isomerase [Petroclostridium sp.]|jgi:phosphoribosylanthranilate isomerase|uniref:phosphoribosylanthranilate isomerase n=1 Tax=Petroclostridium xylanilyticum TaxID=1792311 RepID=UPI000B98FD7A|nr:phosphoribosylanthranilate isomerase [Petroclostridium xylanilyticum]MBZ4644792.1 phosphoribosylanthranilate isomerase [Clostridia bacterium]MDK2810888.1 phosphoribosylanthranilate isomerase [Petroclostridium sp.]